MKKAFDTPEIVAAIFTVIGMLLVSLILGFLEGRIGFESLVTLVFSPPHHPHHLD